MKSIRSVCIATGSNSDHNLASVQNACEKMQKEYSDKMAELCRREEEAKKQVGT